MNAFARFITWPNRRWRGGGFGVHSPFAFDFITKVIGERSRFYAYERISCRSRRDMRERCLLIRCICRFRPSTVKICSENSCIASTVSATDTGIVIVNGDADMLVIDTPQLYSGEKAELTVVRNLDRKENADLWRKLTGEMSRGMDFSNGQIGIICAMPHLPRQSFKITIPLPSSDK